MRPPTKILALGAFLLVLFCVSFFLFYKWGRDERPLILRSTVIGRPLPEANLVNISGERLDDGKLRRGKVVLLFTMTDCKFCDQENEFLKTVAGARSDVNFYYVLPFGVKDNALREAQGKYAFETFYDEGSLLARSLQIHQVPIQVYLEDGIIKKTWIDSTIYNQRDDEYKRWMSRL